MKIFNRKNKSLLTYFFVSSFIFMAQSAYCFSSIDSESEQNQLHQEDETDDLENNTTLKVVLDMNDPNETKFSRFFSTIWDRSNYGLRTVLNETKLIIKDLGLIGSAGGEVLNYLAEKTWNGSKMISRKTWNYTKKSYDVAYNASEKLMDEVYNYKKVVIPAFYVATAIITTAMIEILITNRNLMGRVEMAKAIVGALMRENNALNNEIMRRNQHYLDGEVY